MSFEYANEANISVPNLIHASGCVEEAEAEIKHWFKEEELHIYQPANTTFTR